MARNGVSQVIESGVALRWQNRFTAWRQQSQNGARPVPGRSGNVGGGVFGGSGSFAGAWPLRAGTARAPTPARRALLVLVAALLFGALPLSAATRLTLVIHHQYGGQPLALDSATLTNAAGERHSVTRLAYLLGEPSLRPAAASDGADGAAGWLTSRDWFAFADAGGGRTTHELRGLPARSFDALRFHIGPDAATDRADPSVYPAQHALNPTVNGLHWGWTGGFVYLALEGNVFPRPGADALGFSYHLAGATNRMCVTLPVALDLTHDTTVELDFQVDRLFAGPPPLRLAEQTSTHSREGDALAGRLKARVESAFTVRTVRRTAPTVALPAAAGSRAPLVGTPYAFTVMKGFPLPELPTDFPLTNERVELGRRLFHDPRLSRDSVQSCATCHQQKAAFTDPRRFSVGVDQRPGTRNAMPLFNLAWKKNFFWDGRAPSLRAQALEPIQNPVEMHASLPDVVAKLAADPATAAAFARAFGTPAVTAERLGGALEAFVLTLTSFNSKFDRALRGEAVLSEAEQRGFELFNTEFDPRRQQFGADCFHCHGGALFTDHAFRNNGLALDPADLGRAAVTGQVADRGRFVTPSLRNVALTAPYMHDGRFATLEEVVAHYDHGVARTASLDPNLGKHPDTGLRLSAADQRALVAFLRALTDEQYGR
ncbi:hypothetical protein LBMAG56_52260 [Verrucomicrobiota bacterium]|nr:hypothetical protein LBMAG56_52260 [Verrucomicrobiota bacterium]